MKKSRLLDAVCGCILVLFTTSTYAVHIGGDTTDKLNVPGDFPGNFGMDLLSGIVAFDVPASGDGITSIDLNTNESSIAFTASAFDGVGAGAGTSNLSVDVDNYAIGSGLFFGFTSTFFIDSSGTGTLTDNGDGTGEWGIDVPLFVDWGPNLGMSLGVISLSTASTVDYWIYGGAGASTPETASGSALDYHTGDAFLVGQALFSSDTPFTGLRITMGLAGNDPAVVPIPAAVWLFGSGLLGLVGIARRRRA